MDGNHHMITKSIYVMNNKINNRYHSTFGYGPLACDMAAIICRYCIMNTVRFKNKTYKYESVFRDDKETITYDSNDKPFPWPEHQDAKWRYQKVFADKLEQVEKFLLTKREFHKYRSPKKCPYDKQKTSTGLFTLNKYRWEDGLQHYIRQHNYVPSEEFVDFIFRYIPPEKKQSVIISRINGIPFEKHSKKFLKVSRNQIMIMDALMEHGGYKRYVDNRDNQVFRYSEHSGLLDFNNTGLEKIVVSANTTRVDKGDSDIYMPKNMIDMLDYEYIFHTHPPTPKVAGRVDQGILYEFPSISDVFHFLDHYNDGKTQGSIVMAPEGMYILRKIHHDNKPIKMNENAFYRQANQIMFDMQDEAIAKYGVKFSDEFFYSQIAQNTYYLDQMNHVYNKHGIQIDYYPRVKDSKGQWVVDTVYLPVYTIEPRSK